MLLSHTQLHHLDICLYKHSPSVFSISVYNHRVHGDQGSTGLPHLTCWRNWRNSKSNDWEFKLYNSNRVYKQNSYFTITKLVPFVY